MLFRGQNILGYRPYADDVVEYFVQKSVANGIDIIRIFDCLNDLRNLQTAVNAANKEKAEAQVPFLIRWEMPILWNTGRCCEEDRGYRRFIYMYQGHGRASASI